MKKLYALFLAVVMMFAMSSVAMAADTASLNINGTEYTVEIQADDSVYTIVDRWAKANDQAIEWKEVNSELGGKGQVLVKLGDDTSKPYNSDELGEYEVYDPEEVNDPVLAEASRVLEDTYPTSGGLYLWLGDGVGMNRTGKYGVYAGEDWMYKVNGEEPAVGTIQKYMNEATVKAGDKITLTYSMVYAAYEM